MFLRCRVCERIHGEITSDDPTRIVVRRSGDTMFCSPTTILCRCGCRWTPANGWDNNEPASTDARQTTEAQCQKPSTRQSSRSR
jgi:hypothetical protein